MNKRRLLLRNRRNWRTTTAGCEDVRRDGSIISTAETLVQAGMPLSPAASAIHHLIDADLKYAPALADVIQRFVEADAYVAHNCSFEKSFIGILGSGLGLHVQMRAPG